MAEKNFLAKDGPLVMGIVNVTPDSFSDGGKYLDPDRAIAHGRRLAAEGADILDIGGESTRPGATPVPVQEELDRVMPVIEGLRGCGVPLSIDTRKAAVMQAALAAGAGMINDITALRGDPESMAVVAGANVPVCLMHMQGDPCTMQDNPVYADTVQEVLDFFRERIDACRDKNINTKRIIIDIGIGFGKSIADNLALIRNVSKFKSFGVPILIGASKKSFIHSLCINADTDQREPGSLATALWCRQQGAKIFRVHDVAAARQAFAVWEAVSGSSRYG